MGTSSKSARAEPRPFVGTYGTTCFCPVSASAANHGDACVRRSHARIAGLSPFEAMTRGSPAA